MFSEIMLKYSILPSSMMLKENAGGISISGCVCGLAQVKHLWKGDSYVSRQGLSDLCCYSPIPFYGLAQGALADRLIGFYITLMFGDGFILWLLSAGSFLNMYTTTYWSVKN